MAIEERPVRLAETTHAPPEKVCAGTGGTAHGCPPGKKILCSNNTNRAVGGSRGAPAAASVTPRRACVHRIRRGVTLAAQTAQGGSQRLRDTGLDPGARLVPGLLYPPIGVQYRATRTPRPGSPRRRRCRRAQPARPSVGAHRYRRRAGGNEHRAGRARAAAWPASSLAPSTCSLLLGGGIAVMVGDHPRSP